MKTFFAAGALLAAVASAQSITDLPTCSLNCVASAVLSLCTSLTDYECACGAATQLTASARPCVEAACSTADQAKVITVLEGICAVNGFPITISPSSSATPEPTPEPTSSSEAEPTTSAAEPTGYSSVVPSGSACTASTTYTTVTVGPSTYPTGYGSNATVTSAYPTAYTGGASANGVTFGAAGLLGLVAYLL